MVKFELTEQQVEIIARALSNAPYGQVAPVIAEMQRQIIQQQQFPASAPTNGKVEEEHARRV